MTESTPDPVHAVSEQAPPRDRDLFGKPPKGRATWDHRRGEPRWFALLWTIFLMGAAAITLGGTAAAGVIDASSYRAGTRLMVLVVSAGIVVLWPMIRLSQRTPERPIVSVMGDLLVVLLPSLVLLSPQALPFLGGWMLWPTVAASALLVSWTLIVGGVLALVWSHGAGPRLALRYEAGDAIGSSSGVGHLSVLARSCWMAALLVLCIGGPAVVLVREAVIGRSLSDAGVDASVGFLLSPVTAPWECIRDRSWSGVPAMVGPGHWVGVLWTGVVAAGIWIGVLVDALILRPDRGYHDD